MASESGQRKPIDVALERRTIETYGIAIPTLVRSSYEGALDEIECLRRDLAAAEMQIEMLRVLAPARGEDEPCAGVNAGEIAHAFPVWVRVPCQDSRYSLRRREAERLRDDVTKVLEATT